MDGDVLPQHARHRAGAGPSQPIVRMAVRCVQRSRGVLAHTLWYWRTGRYEDVASKFMEHFISIAHSISDTRMGLWDPDSKFFCDVLRSNADPTHATYLKVSAQPCAEQS